MGNCGPVYGVAILRSNAGQNATVGKTSEAVDADCSQDIILA
jgi:hypothetical protein